MIKDSNFFAHSVCTRWARSVAAAESPRFHRGPSRRAVAWLGRYHGSMALRAALIALVAVLMALNAVGAYGFLAKAHIEHQVAGDVQINSRGADVEASLGVQAGVVADFDRRIAQIDTAVRRPPPAAAPPRP